MSNRPTITYLIDPRFPGGTSSAVARELALACDLGVLKVACLSSGMFKGEKVAPVLEETFSKLGIVPVWDPPQVSADLVVLQNPAMLKFQSGLPIRVIARQFVVVTHENFLRPSGEESFDVGKCLSQIDRATLALKKVIAPISPWNRKTVFDWSAANGDISGWSVLEEDWFNICDFDLAAPNRQPRDRRGRLSRPGFEKFPPIADLDLCFPRHAEANVILGGDTFLSDGYLRPHWTLLPFGSLDVAEFFDKIDFMVYYTSPSWRESFGRVLAEGIAAGKVVISDAETAAIFDGGVIGARPEEVDGLIADFVAHPKKYQQFVRKAQGKLSRFSAGSFQAKLSRNLGAAAGQAA